jgi:hypothetical protein
MRVFHERAASSAAVVTSTVSLLPTSAMLAMVVATADPRSSGPRKIPTVAMTSATPGRAARVATRVAIEFVDPVR